jgi:hypothetical protein
VKTKKKKKRWIRLSMELQPREVQNKAELLMLLDKMVKQNWSVRSVA